ncbi:MAG TPA: hypothetical protein VNQ73_14535 [Ilumatobacter sp.]|nr:hypothetical protein [Ilumatobacter sp.]
MHTVVVRVWLPDRPGALGQVASRIGSVKGDVLGIDILEAGGGRVIDELVVALPDSAVVDLMVNEVHAIDGVSVEHVRPTVDEHTDGGQLALALAAELAETDAAGRTDTLVNAVARLTEGAWALLCRDDTTVAAAGEPPSTDYVSALIAGRQHLGDHRASDLFWSPLPLAGMWVAAGRPDRPVHDRERARLDLFTRIADVLLAS